MSIEELELELKNTKACAYDINREYEKLTKKIDEIEEEINKLKENGKSLESSSLVSEDIPQEEVNEEVQENTEVIPQVNEAQEVAVVTPVAENTTEAVQENAVVIPQVNDVQETAVVTPIAENNIAAVQENAVVIPQANSLEESAAVTSIAENTDIQTNNVVVDVPGPQQLPQGTLVPNVEGFSSLEEKVEEKTVYNKVDTNDARAISTTTKQIASLRASKGEQKAIVTKLMSTKSAADYEQDIQVMLNDLANAKTEEEANIIKKNIAETEEKRQQLVKIA